MAKPRTQRELVQTLLKKQGIMRLLELREAGVTKDEGSSNCLRETRIF